MTLTSNRTYGALKHAIKAASVVGFYLMCAPQAFADSPAAYTSPAPVVTGNTITVERDGWYQFQNAETFEEVCAGVFSCSVPAGNYIVINHTLSARWEPVIVADSVPDIDVPMVGIPLIEGNTIRFPDSGWYEVQNAETFESICNGAATCEVHSGDYNIINHTTGQRWDWISVIGNDAVVPGLGNTILLPSDGWYQVQNVADFRSLCEGVTACEAGWGTYNVINLTTGQRFEGVELGPDTTPPVVPDTEEPYGTAFSLTSANATDVLRNVIGVINEDQIDTLFDNAGTDLNFFNRQFFISNTVDDIVFSQGVDLATPYQHETSFESGEFVDIPVRSEYTCASGGSIYVYFKDRQFNDCVAGNHTYNGISGRRNDALRGLIRNYPFWNFSATDSTGITSTLNGGYFTGNTSFVVLNQTQGWSNATFSTILSDGVFQVDDFTINRLDKSDTNLSFNITGFTQDDGTFVQIRNNSRSSSIDGSFTVKAGWSQQQAIAVEISLSFDDTIRVPVDSSITEIPGGIDPEDPFNWLSGNVTITAADGSSLVLTPDAPAGETFSLLLSNGETITSLRWNDGFTIDCGSSDICGE